MIEKKNIISSVLNIKVFRLIMIIVLKKKEKSISPHYRIPLIVEKKIKSLQILLT